MVDRKDFPVRLIWTSAAFVAILAFLAKEVLTTYSSVVMLDVWFENFLLTVRTPLLLGLFNLVTLLGNTLLVIGIAGVVSVILFFKSDKFYIAGLATTLLGAATSAYLIKDIVGRARPGGLIPSMLETSFSFPSGHATAAIALYGFIAFLLCRHYSGKARTIVAAASIVIVVIGFSRLYLGVHFPSDVVAGYLVGGWWLLAGMWLTDTLQARRAPVI